MIKNKHSQEASTMVWIIATVIIIFIVFIFLGLTLFMSEEDKIKKLYQSSNIEAGKSAKKDIALAESIYGVLNTKTDFNGKKIKVADMIEESLNPYTEFKLQLNKNRANPLGGVREATTTDEYFEGDINKFDLNRVPQEIRGGVTEIKDAIENDNKMFVVLADILNPICSDYMFKIPQGVIRKGNSGFAPEIDTVNTINSEKLRYEWTPWTSINLFYKGQIVEIKYRRLIEC